MAKINDRYGQSLDAYYDQYLKDTVTKYDNENKGHLNLKWETYLKYNFTLNGLGVIGFFLIVLFQHRKYFITTNVVGAEYDDKEGKTHTWLYWLGFSICMLETIGFEISNGIFLIHSFFLELWNVLGPKPSSQ